MKQLMPYRSFAFSYFCYFLFVGAWIAYWPLWLKEQGFQAQQIGSLVAALLATKIIAPSLWGFIADQRGQHLQFLRICGLVGFICFSAIFWRQDFYWLLLLIFAFSFFWNAFMPQLEVLTLTSLANNKHDARYTQVRVWGSLGFVIIVTALGIYFDHYSIEHLPTILFLLLGLILLSGWLLPDINIEQRSASSPQIKQVLKQPAVISFFLICFLLQASHGPYYTFFSVYLDDLGYSRQSIGWLWSLGVLAEIVLYIYMRYLYARFSLRVLLCTSLILAMLRWILIANLATSLSILIFAQLLHAFSYGCYHAVGVVLIKRFFAGGNEATGMGLYSSVSFGAGGTLGAYLSGLIWDLSPWICFMIAAFVALIAFFVAWLFIDGEQVTTPVLS